VTVIAEPPGDIRTQQIDSELGRWTQVQWEPAASDPLFGAVEKIWDFEGALDCARERVFPSGRLGVVVQLDDPHRLAGSAEPFPALCVDGLATVGTTIEAPPGRCRVLGITLHPLGAFAILANPLHDLSDRSVDLFAVIGSSAGSLGTKLDAARTGRERIGIAIDWTRRRSAKSRPVDALVATALARIERGYGALAISAIDELSGRSRSRFAAAFRDHVGLTPKRYTRIVRFRHAMELLSTTAMPLVAVAEASGYYDQAHLTAEFRLHSAMTPGAYRVSQRYPGSQHLAEYADEDVVTADSFFQDGFASQG
jgi:AraC-like DNA-binding protein